MLKIGYALYGPPRWAMGVSNSHTAMSDARMYFVHRFEQRVEVERGTIGGGSVRPGEMLPQSLMEQQIAVDQHGNAIRIRAVGRITVMLLNGFNGLAVGFGRLGRCRLGRARGTRRPRGLAAELQHAPHADGERHYQSQRHDRRDDHRYRRALRRMLAVVMLPAVLVHRVSSLVLCFSYGTGYPSSMDNAPSSHAPPSRLVKKISLFPRFGGLTSQHGVKYCAVASYWRSGVMPEWPKGAPC